MGKDSDGAKKGGWGSFVCIFIGIGSIKLLCAAVPALRPFFWPIGLAVAVLIWIVWIVWIGKLVVRPFRKKDDEE